MEKTVDFMAKHLSFYDKLTKEQQKMVTDTMMVEKWDAARQFQTGDGECRGLLLLVEGQLRVFYTSNEGKEMTLYRLLPGDVCIMTISCVLRDITFSLQVEVEKPSKIITVPTAVFKALYDENPAVKDFAVANISRGFSDVFWMMEQMAFKSMSARVATFLLEQYAIEGTDKLVITHEAIANHVGTAREVISRVLKHMEQEGLLSLQRGKISLIDIKRLKKIAYE